MFEGDPALAVRACSLPPIQRPGASLLCVLSGVVLFGVHNNAVHNVVMSLICEFWLLLHRAPRLAASSLPLDARILTLVWRWLAAPAARPV